MTACISVIEPVGGHGGMNYYDIGLCRGLTNAGCDVTLYTCDETVVTGNEGFTVKLEFRGIYGNRNKFLRGIRFIQGLIVSLVDSRKRGVRVVHMHFFHAGFLERIATTLVFLFGFRLVLTVHDVESLSGKGKTSTAKNIFSQANAIIVHNEVSRTELVDSLNIDPQKVSIIRHGNYCDFLRPVGRDLSRRKLGIAVDCKLILFFGQIKSVKGLDLLLKAFASFRMKNPDAVLLIAGKVWKDEFSKYREIIDSLGINEFVMTHIRYISDEDVKYYYSSADVVVLPYRKIYQSGVLLMAMSMRCLVVASDLQGMKEVVKDGETGYLFKADDENSLSEKLNDALSENFDAYQVVQSAYSLMIADYSWTSIGNETTKLYLKVAKNQ